VTYRDDLAARQAEWLEPHGVPIHGPARSVGPAAQRNPRRPATATAPAEDRAPRTADLALVAAQRDLAGITRWLLGRIDRECRRLDLVDPPPAPGEATSLDTSAALPDPEWLPWYREAASCVVRMTEAQLRRDGLHLQRQRLERGASSTPADPAQDGQLVADVVASLTDAELDAILAARAKRPKPVSR